ncbi:hypothetical protein [Alteromonas confluentis]|uniref:Uncharacterized protein n=1 Tax=Alteromonas confluentis TaxID=1656094 RepID=A0A1E7ZCK3_9ALTE|nr:hypothetical protein [Alteromonas confluentis]OFC71237.1 hypothetical protein BFC18_08745 [Alteromonas confluentis]
MTHINTILAAALTLSVSTAPVSAGSVEKAQQNNADNVALQTQNPSSEQSLFGSFADVIEEKVNETLQQRLAEIEHTVIDTITQSFKY